MTTLTNPTFLGSTFDEARDGKRLTTQVARVYRLMADSQWRTLAEIELMTGYPQASVSARLRDFRRLGLVVNRVYVRRGLFRYRLIVV